MRQAGSARAWVLAFILGPVAGLGILLGVGCAIGANACPLGDSKGTPASASGEEIFAMNCALCHGAAAQGGRGPSLVTGPSAGLTREQLLEKIGRGSPGLMPRFKGHLTPEQIERVAGYILGLRASDDREPS